MMTILARVSLIRSPSLLFSPQRQPEPPSRSLSFPIVRLTSPIDHCTPSFLFSTFSTKSFQTSFSFLLKTGPPFTPETVIPEESPNNAVQSNPLLRMWNKTLRALVFYKNGSLQFLSNWRLASSIHKHSASVREKMFLKQVTKDKIMLIPLLIYIALPASVVIIPLALRFFPNSLPSVFIEPSQKCLIIEAKAKVLHDPKYLSLAAAIKSILAEDDPMIQQVFQSFEDKKFIHPDDIAHIFDFSRYRSIFPKLSSNHLKDIREFYEKPLSLWTPSLNDSIFHLSQIRGFDVQVIKQQPVLSHLEVESLCCERGLLFKDQNKRLLVDDTQQRILLSSWLKLSSNTQYLAQMFYPPLLLSLPELSVPRTFQELEKCRVFPVNA